ncbi:MAG TPA: hypothetical protein VLC09_13600 [Polyangiaceae bacterium]|nr:hypothetical protein [Polyangiaceae bacterium]
MTPILGVRPPSSPAGQRSESMMPMGSRRAGDWGGRRGVGRGAIGLDAVGLGAVGLGALLLGCGSTTPATSTASGEPTAVTTKAETTGTPPAGGAILEAPPLPPFTELLESELLARLEAHGLDLASLLGGTPGADNAALARSPNWASVVHVLERDLDELRAADPAAGVSVARFSHRTFDVGFLSSPSARFRLVGVTARLDRRPFDATACGETRLIYRLEYRDPRTRERSPLPATVALEYLAGASADDCADVARRLQLPPGSADERAEWLVGTHGPLGRSRLQRERAQLVVNLQSVRWPSTVRPALGGHAEYILRAFRARADRFEPSALENTPDVPRLLNDTRLRNELRELLRADAARGATERGQLLLPERFLAKRVSSVTPRGLARRANRPFRSLFRAEELQDPGAPTWPGPRLRSAEGYLRRLDELSCPGCHQSRSVAGFHLLGTDDDDLPAGAALAVGSSPHFVADGPRRLDVARAWLEGRAADEAIPFPERGETTGSYGSACGLGDPSFASWTCDAGLECRPYDAPEAERELVGACLPVHPQTGDPCEYGPLAPNVDGRKDGVQGSRDFACKSGEVCNENRVGFPGGMCTASCAGLDEHGRCGALAVLDSFNACLARAEPFGRCVTEHSRPSGLRACSLEVPCRDDYACARSQEGGVCVPPYFLFPLRVDGHVSSAR